MRRNAQHLLHKAAALRKEHGAVHTAGMMLFWAFARLTGAAILACMHKPVGVGSPTMGRLLSRDEIERASHDAGMDLLPEFVSATRDAKCYGVVIENQVRCYAWSTSMPVRGLPGTIVAMSPDISYVFKAFTDAAFRRRGLLGECLKAIEADAARDGRGELSALVEMHNRSSLRAFRGAGFEQCGRVLILRRPWLVKRIGCRCAHPCGWDRDASVPAALSEKPVPADRFLP